MKIYLLVNCLPWWVNSLWKSNLIQEIMEQAIHFFFWYSGKAWHKCWFRNSKGSSGSTLCTSVCIWSYQSPALFFSCKSLTLVSNMYFQFFHRFCYPIFSSEFCWLSWMYSWFHFSCFVPLHYLLAISWLDLLMRITRSVEHSLNFRPNC